MPSLGEAYISVHAETSAFQNELQAQVTKSTAAIEKSQRNTRTSPTNLRAKDTADNKAFVAAYLDGIRQVQGAERAAYAEQTTRNRAAATAVREIAKADREAARAAKEASDAHRDFSDRLVNLSSTLSRIGFTGQTRLVTLGATFGFPLATLAAFTLAAAGAAAAVTVFGIKSADAARSATQQFQSLGLTAEQAKAQFASLQALSNKGLQIANLDADASRLLQLGVNAKDTTGILKEFADIFSANGDTGATLQKDIDDTAKKFATLVNTAKITPRTFQTAVASLGIGVTSQAVFDQLKKNLDITTKQLDDIIAKGKLTGGAVAGAALQAASPGSKGALDKSVASSPTQALEALKSSAQSTLAGVFQASGTTIAGFIGQLSSQLNDFIKSFGPRVVDILTKVVPNLIAAIKPFGDALLSSLSLVEPLLKSIAPIVSHLSADVTNFFGQAKTGGSDTNNILGAMHNLFQEVLDLIHAATPASEALASGLGIIAVVVGDLEPAIKLLSDVIHALTNNEFAKFIISGTVVAVAFSAALGIAAKVLQVVIPKATEAAFSIAAMATAEGRAVIGARAMTAANEALSVSNVEVAATARAAAGAEGIAGIGGAAGGAAAKTGILTRGLNLAKGGLGGLAGVLGIAAPELAGVVIALTAAGIAGYKLGEYLTKSSRAIAAAQAHANELAPSWSILAGTSDNLVLSIDQLSQHLGDVGIKTLAASVQAGSYTDIAAGMIKALYAQGDTADQVAVALEGMGVSTQNAQNAINGIDTSGAVADLYRFQVAALEADGAVRRTISDAQIAAQLGGTVDDPDGAFFAAAQVAAATPGPQSLAEQLAGITPVGSGGSTGAGGGGGAASAAKQKIASAFANLSDDLKAIADKTSEQTASQIKSEFTKLIKDLNDSGNKAYVAGTKSIEKNILARIAKLKPLQDKLAAELTLGQAVKDSVITSGAIDRGSGIATTFSGIQNKLRFSVATTQQFITAIKKLQTEKLNRTSIKQLIDNFSSDPAGALAEAQALISAGQAGITGPGGINSLQGTLTDLGNQLGNDTAGELYKQGQHIGDGLIEGLKSKVKEAEKVINDLADKMEKALKKKTKSHSPSEVYAEIGGDIVDGLVGGIGGGASKVANAASGMAQTLITFGPGSVAVNNADPKNPSGSGLMVGHGIVGVLERNRTQAALLGVG